MAGSSRKSCVILRHPNLLGGLSSIMSFQCTMSTPLIHQYTARCIACSAPEGMRTALEMDGRISVVAPKLQSGDPVFCSVHGCRVIYCNWAMYKVPHDRPGLVKPGREGQLQGGADGELSHLSTTGELPSFSSPTLFLTTATHHPQSSIANIAVLTSSLLHHSHNGR